MNEDKLIVCDCKNINYAEVREAINEYGYDMELIMEKTAAGSACECCLELCDRVDMTLPVAIEKIRKEQKNQTEKI